MRPVTITLGVLVRDAVNDNAWPGIDEEIIFNDAACPSVGGDTPSFLLEQGFVVMGFDASESDSFPAPDGWQFFTQGQAAALIAGWEAAELEWHAATKIICSNDPDNFWIVSDSYFDVLSALTICCATPNILTQAFALKSSNGPLVPGEVYPCGNEAAFKFLAIFGSQEVRSNLVHTFRFTLHTPEGDPPNDKTFNFPLRAAFTGTVQSNKRWPEDFFGMISTDAVHLIPMQNFLVYPWTVLGADIYDGGTIDILAIIEEETSPGVFAVVSTSQNTFALPIGDCAPHADVNVGGFNQITSVKVNGVLVIPVNGSEMPVNSGEDKVFKTYEMGTHTVEIEMNNAGGVNITDSDSNNQSTSIPSAGTAVFNNVVIKKGLAISIVAP